MKIQRLMLRVMVNLPIKSSFRSQASVAHTCNPSFLGDRDQEDHSSKPTWEKSLLDSISKIPSAKWTDEVAQVVECLPKEA
jgi:hypothetical protein